jgi:UDP-2,3-diacylglucosamine pyrophosphatase LpxH
VALLEWYRQRRLGGRPWRLVFAGDLVDFVGMSVSAAPEEIETELTEEEREHGLGSAVDHTIAKLRRVAENHRDVFAALARFVASGNELLIVRGNHDVDFHWKPVQDELCKLLARHARIDAGRVEFVEWFYYEEGRVYIEHGHQYDDYCAHEHVLHPVLPSDPRRSYRSLSDILLRYVVRPTRGMSESGHEHATAFDYLRFALRLGSSGMLTLGRRFLVAIAALVAVWRDHFSDAARWVREEHERKLALLAEARQISLIKLRALALLQRPPVTRSLLRILAGVMLDRIAMAVAGLIALIFVLVTRWTPELGIGVGLGVASIGTGFWLWRRARGAIDASQSLREGAARVASLFPAAFVVMGHTHLPEVHSAGAHTYVNLGAWAEEDAPDGSKSPSPASRTHLVVEDKDGMPVASLLTWDSTGPRRFLSR